MPDPTRSSRHALDRCRAAYAAALRRHERTLVAAIDAVRLEIATLATPDATDTPTAALSPEPSATPRFADTGQPPSTVTTPSGGLP